MKNSRIFLATMAIAMLFVASCQKESSVKQEFTACMEEGTSDAKTTLVNSSLQWQHGTDQVSITGIATTTNTDNTTSTQTTTSTFTAVAHSSYPNNLSYANLNLNEGETALTEPSTNTTVSYRAIYPASIARDNNTKVTLPKVQESTSGELTGYPMYAQSENKSLQFKNLCSVLKLSLTGSETISKIEVYTDKYINGTYYVRYNETTGEPTLEIDAAANTATDHHRKLTTLTMSSPVTLSSSPSYFYIYLPVQEYKYIKINLYNEDNLVYSKAASRTSGVTLGRSKYYDLTLSTPEFEPGVLCGEFTVNSDGLKVSFSRGNMIIGSRTIEETTSEYSYTTSWGRTYSGTYVSAIETTDIFKFADNQYDRNEGIASNITPSYKKWLFEWGVPSNSTSPQKWWYYTNTTTARVNVGSSILTPHYLDQTHIYSSTHQDIAENDASWRSLTQPEWDFVLKYNSNRMQYYNKYGERQPNNINRCYALATVNNIHGVLIFPDVFYWPLDEKEAAFGSSSSWSLASNTYDLAQWKILEGAGCVFLPATGSYTNSDDHTSETDQNTYGAYWAGEKVGNTYNAPKYYRFSSTSSAFDDNQNGNETEQFYAIRLVKVNN